MVTNKEKLKALLRRAQKKYQRYGIMHYKYTKGNGGNVNGAIAGHMKMLIKNEEKAMRVYEARLQKLKEAS